MKIVIAFLLMCSVVCAGNVTMKPNNFGGYNFYNGGKKIGHSRSSNFGGQKFYDNRGRMGHFYGNGTGTFNYRGNAHLGTNKGAVFSGLRQGIRGPSGRYGQRPSNRTGSAGQLRSGNAKGK